MHGYGSMSYDNMMASLHVFINSAEPVGKIPYIPVAFTMHLPFKVTSGLVATFVETVNAFLKLGINFIVCQAVQAATDGRWLPLERHVVASTISALPALSSNHFVCVLY